MDPMPTRLLIVDDDAELRGMLQTYLGQHGYTAHAVADGAAMDAYLATQRVDLVVLDLMLPGEDGLSLARRLRAASAVPIVMLSARGDDVDRIVGLEMGADDYLSKPFNPRELLARIKAVLRRPVPAPAETESDIKAFGPFRLNLSNHSLTRDGDNLPLTTAEFTLLRVFLQHARRVLSRDQLVDLVQGHERMPFDRSIDVRVARLRRKIETDPDNPRYIRTVWGAGYLFSPTGDDE
jgi:DNA-binding response OmpR family regulator